jgi:hypothetical protein
MDESMHEALEALREAIEVWPEEGGNPVVDPPVSPREDQIPVFEAPNDTRRGDLRWADIAAHVGANLGGRRVLLVGPRAGHDALAFAPGEPDYLLACEPPDRLHDAEVLASRDGSRIELIALPWHTLDPDRHGSFDIVHCGGLLHRVLEPMMLLRTLRRMTIEGGVLLVESMILGDPERSEFLRFVPARYAGDPSWWFVPGRLAFRWLVETAGFRVEAEFGEVEGPRDGFPVGSGYLRAVAVEPPE